MTYFWSRVNIWSWKLLLLIYIFACLENLIINVGLNEVWCYFLAPFNSPGNMSTQISLRFGHCYNASSRGRCLAKYDTRHRECLQTVRKGPLPTIYPVPTSMKDSCCTDGTESSMSLDVYEADCDCWCVCVCLPCFLAVREMVSLKVLQLELSPPHTPHLSSCFEEPTTPSQPTFCSLTTWKV